MRRTILALTLLAGCNPNDFNGLLDRAPVQFVGRPDGFGPNGGRMLLPLPPPADQPKMAARLVFAGTEARSLGVVDFDGDGKPHTQTLSAGDFDQVGLSNNDGGIASATWLSGATPTSPVTLVLGMPRVGPTVPTAGRVAFATLTPKDGRLSLVPSIPLPIDGPGDSGHFGIAVARGQVTQAAAQEAIVLADNSMHVLSSAGGELARMVSNANCPISLPAPPDLYRTLAVADFLDGGNQEIAIGLPVLGGRGRVVLLQYGLNAGKPGLLCGPSWDMPDSAGEMAISGFGTSLVAVPDMNGDGLAELVVGAPPDRAYLFYSPFDGSTKPKLFIKKDDIKSEFGQRVALVDIDGDGVKELAITALQANVGNTPKAGQVLVFKLDGDGTTPIAVLNDSHPTANKEFFGIGLAELEFNSARACAKGKDAHILVAGADAGIFTFFRFAGGAPDPRCFAQK